MEVLIHDVVDFRTDLLSVRRAWVASGSQDCQALHRHDPPDDLLRDRQSDLLQGTTDAPVSVASLVGRKEVL
jgi:hypothetical protein